MKLYQELKDLDLIISELTKELKFSKYKNKALERLNRLIDVRNSYFNVLSSNFYFDSLDTLILSNVLLRLQLNKSIPNHTNIDFCFKEVYSDIKIGMAYKYAEIEDRIITELRLKDIKKDNKENLLNEYPKEKIQKAILDMLDILKTDMIWKLKK